MWSITSTTFLVLQVGLRRTYKKMDYFFLVFRSKFARLFINLVTVRLSPRIFILLPIFVSMIRSIRPPGIFSFSWYPSCRCSAPCFGFALWIHRSSFSLPIVCHFFFMNSLAFRVSSIMASFIPLRWWWCHWPLPAMVPWRLTSPSHLAPYLRPAHSSICSCDLNCFER